jgi:hypothetical protein
MGMFDDINCKYPLPMPAAPQGYTGSVDFQTKSLNNALDKFEIREDGTLWILNVTYETTDDQMLPFKIKDTHWVPHNITQTIEIHDYISSTKKGLDYSIEYQITIIDGKVQKVDLTRFVARDNSYRLEQQRVHTELMKQRWAFESTLVYRIIFRPYNEIIRFVFKHLCRANRCLYNNLWKLERKLSI